MRDPVNIGSTSIVVQPVLARLVGIPILQIPGFLDDFVCVYWIVIGVPGLMHLAQQQPSAGYLQILSDWTDEIFATGER
jgi:hypothetical protein